MPMNQELVLPAELTIYNAAELRVQLLAHVEAHAQEEACCIDAAAVDQVDAAGLQLLLALTRTLAAAGRTLRLAPASPVLAAAVDALGLRAALLGATAEGAAA
jgi:anti-anti-sigma regulatory factor